jgi:hypothetical protein
MHDYRGKRLNYIAKMTPETCIETSQRDILYIYMYFGVETGIIQSRGGQQQQQQRRRSRKKKKIMNPGKPVRHVPISTHNREARLQTSTSKFIHSD